MSEFVIESIARTRSWVNGLLAHLDAPVESSHVQPRHSLSLQGWVACTSSDIVRIRLMWLETQLATAKLVQRPDVEAALEGKPNVTGFRLDVTPLVMGDREPLRILIETADGRSSTVFEITLRFTATDASHDDIPAFAPILASARSGTTLLSRMLHQHAGVLGHDEYPYEARIGIRLAEEWFAASQPRYYEPDYARDAKSMDQNLVAAFSAFEQRDEVSRTGVGRFLEAKRLHYRDQIVDFYRLVDPESAGRVIVEKLGMLWDLDLVAGLFPRTKPIFIVRDPRDMLVSMRALNERRGYYDFHEIAGKRFEALLPIMSVNLHHLAWHFERWPGEKLLLRYEDVVRDLRSALLSVLQFLDLDHDEASLAACLHEGNDRSSHVTSGSTDDSMERWRTFLTPSQTKLANWFFEPFIRRFGYPD